MADHDVLGRWVDDHADEIVEALQGVLRIPSTKQEPDGPGAPYGKPVRESLDYTLSLCGKLGFSTADIDGHAGHAEFGEGEEMVAAVGHLDVVPAGDGWTYPPFEARIHDGRIYARGASDDKGPTYAALFAAKALMDSGLPIRRRVRVIFGCDEESGFGCVKHYWEVAGQEKPVMAFTPDAYFPLVYAEKGICTFVLERELPAGSIVSSAMGGRRSNMVPDAAEARIAGGPERLYPVLSELVNHWDRNVQVIPDTEGIWVRARGKSGHASRPSSGDNAIARLARALLAVAPDADRRWLAFVARSTDPSGAGLGIDGRDDIAGPLTCNAAILDIAGGRARVTYNVRYPVTWTEADVLARLEPVASQAGWTVASHEDNPPLHVPLDAEPVSTLLRVYREETGDTRSQPGTMGGGTYARSIPNAVAFGAVFQEAPDGPAHEPDERIAVSSLLRAAKIYARALYELAR